MTKFLTHLLLPIIIICIPIYFIINNQNNDYDKLLQEGNKATATVLKSNYKYFDYKFNAKDIGSYTDIKRYHPLHLEIKSGEKFTCYYEKGKPDNNRVELAEFIEIPAEKLIVKEEFEYTISNWNDQEFKIELLYTLNEIEYYRTHLIKKDAIDTTNFILTIDKTNPEISYIK